MLRPAQPGHEQLDQHLQQQKNQMYTQPPHQIMQMLQQQQMQQSGLSQGIAPPEQAIQNIQNQIKSFYETYPQYTNLTQQMTSPVIDMSHTMPMMTTPVIQQRSGTPPNGFLPTPPPTQKTTRVLRHVDVAPMPMNMANVPIVQIQQPMGQDVQLFADSFGSEYCSSSYQSSMVDPLSPSQSPMKHPSMRSMSMPTLYEDDAMLGAQGMMTSDQLLLAATQGGHDMRAYYADSPMRAPMSPREQLLANLEVDASIQETGISAEEVQSYISEQDPVDSKWVCLFTDCGKRFGRKENIRSHVQTHLDDRQFRCNGCGKCFVRQHDLKRHAKIHSGDKPHKCPCGNGFARQDALTRHRQRGVCEGALPGFERREVKRGRPKKNRPDMVDRVDKASRARKMDARRGSEAQYTSSSSGASVRSDPFTPPHISDAFDNASFGGEDDLQAFLTAQEDTPPTSPLTAGTSPAATHNSFHANSSTFDFAAPQSYHSPSGASDHVSPHSGTATYDFAPSHVSPAQISSPSHSHLDFHSSPRVVQTSSTNTISAAAGSGASQADSFTMPIYDWGAIEPQPSLVADSFSPAGGSPSSDLSDDMDGFGGNAFAAELMQGKSGDFQDLFEMADDRFDGDGMGGGLQTGRSEGGDVFARQLEGWLALHGR